MTSKLFKVFFLSLLLVVCNSCKKDKPEDDIKPAEKTLTLITDNVEPGQIVLAQASEAPAINPDTKISISGQPVNVFDAGDNRLGFLMPVLPSGKVAVDYTNAGFAKTLDVNIKQYTTITEPEPAINNFTSEIEKSIANLEEHAKNNVTALDADYIELAKYLNQTVKDNFKTLSEAEKLQVAYYFRSHMPNADQFTLDSINKEFYLGKNDSQSDPGESLVRTGKSMVKNVIIGYPATKAGFALAILPSPTLVDKIAATGFLTVGLIHIMDAMSDIKRIGKFTGVADAITDAFQKRAEKLVFAANQEETVTFKARYRNLNMGDSKSANAEIAAIFGALNTLTNGYNNCVAIANKVISWFPWKSPKIPTYNNPIGSQSATRELNLPGNRLTISNVSNPEIKVTYKQNESSLAVKASSENIIKETDFTFTVKFTDPALGIVLEKQIEATIKPKTYFLLDDANAWVVPPTSFETGKARTFYLSEDKMTKATGIDYSKISFVNKSLDQKVLVNLTNNATSFSLKFTHTEETTQHNTIEIYYDGRLVQTIAAEITNPCSSNKILGSWKLQSYYNDSNNPDGYSASDYYWDITIFENGKMDMRASTESTVNSRTYYFSGCRFSYDHFGCSHSFTIQEGVNEYSISGCGGFHHHVYTRQ